MALLIENKKICLDEVEAGNHYKNCQFSYSMERLRFSDVTFERCEFQQTEFDDSEWLDCRFIYLDWSNCTLNNSVFYRCVFEKCNLTGANFYFNNWKNNQVFESKTNYLNFSESAIEMCEFIDTNLQESYFQSVKIKKGLKFIRCELNEADFLDTKLNHVDFSRSYFDSLRISVDQMKGCIINPLQASVLIRLIGVKISDDY